MAVKSIFSGFPEKPNPGTGFCFVKNHPVTKTEQNKSLGNIQTHTQTDSLTDKLVLKEKDRILLLRD